MKAHCNYLSKTAHFEYFITIWPARHQLAIGSTGRLYSRGQILKHNLNRHMVNGGFNVAFFFTVWVNSTSYFLRCAYTSHCVDVAQRTARIHKQISDQPWRLDQSPPPRDARYHLLRWTRGAQQPPDPSRRDITGSALGHFRKDNIQKIFSILNIKVDTSLCSQEDREQADDRTTR